jgi:hypothetical protein
MTVRTLTRTAVITALLVFPATAQADDASLYRAYTGHDKELDRLSDKYDAARRSFDRADKHHFAPRKARRIITADRNINAALDRVIPGIRREQPSSDFGKQAKPHAINELADWRLANVWEMRAVRRYLHRHWKASQRAWLRAYDVSLRGYHEHKRAAALFKKAGFG